MTGLNENSYFEKKLTSEDLSDASLYVGRGAGKELMADLNCAREEVIVAVPLISSSHVDELLRLRAKGVNVTLITNKVENRRNESRLLDKLVSWDAEDNPRRMRRRRRELRGVKWEIATVILRDILGVAGVAYGVLLIINAMVRSSRYGFYADLWMLLVIGVIVAFIGSLIFFWEKPKLSQLRKKLRDIRKKDGAGYHFESTIDFVYNGNPHEFIHSKIYIIDRSTVYCGSMNFTSSSLNDHVETMVRISSPKVVEELRAWLISSYGSRPESQYKK